MSSLMAVCAASISFFLLRMVSLCSLKLTYWSSAFLFTWLNFLRLSLAALSFFISFFVSIV